MRFADVRGDVVVFTYEGDIFKGSIRGGEAYRITSDKGEERYAKISPDGKWIAFSGEYDGGIDVYVMPITGGEPKRLTYHPAPDLVLGWTPDSQNVLFRTRREYPFRGEQIYTVNINGGNEKKLPVDRGGLASLSPDGKYIAYCRLSGENATWKRHEGGDAQEIWMGSLETHNYKVIAPWRGIDNYPMWYKDGIYFLSDREKGTMNIFRYDVKSGEVRAITHYDDFDVKYPSLGDGNIIYQYKEKLQIINLETETIIPLSIRIVSDRVKVRGDYVDPAENTGTFGLSPDGKTFLLESRGEILTIPVEKEKGLPKNLTNTSGVREKNPAFSPDGKWIAYISDKTGEEEIYLIDAQGEKPPKQLTTGNKGFRMNLVWSPDSKYILFHDKYMKLNLLDVASGKIEIVDVGEYDDGWERWGIQDYVFSPDSKWIAYTKKMANSNEVIYLYSIVEKKSYPVTTDLYENFSPSFDPKGRYLYFLSNRSFEPIMGVVDQEHIFLNTTKPYLALLSKNEPNPFAVSFDEKTEKKEEKTDSKDKKATNEPQSKIDPVGIMERTFAVENVEAGMYFRLEATEDGFLMLKEEEPVFENCYTVVTDKTADKYNLLSYNLKEKKISDGIKNINNYHPSADRKKVVYKSDKKFGVIDANGKGNVGDGAIDLSSAKFKIDFKQEFSQIFNEAYRIERDWFYDKNLHGVDFEGLKNRLAEYIPECGTRSDLNYLIGEMISELNVGHTYVWGGDLKAESKRANVVLLGVDLDFSENYPKIAKIYQPEEVDPEIKPPFYGTFVKEGNYIIAVDGRETKTDTNFYSLLENRNKVVEVLVNDKPQKEGAKKVLVNPIRNEMALRYRVWVDENRKKVAKLSDGRVGYVHIPDMQEEGLKEFARTYYSQLDKPAILIDDRYNSGGFTGDMLIARLERKVWAATQPREGKPSLNPEKGCYSHLALLINEDTGSCGEFYATAFKMKSLGKVFGMRTWGGAMGIEAHQDLVDGGTVTPPQFGLYSLDRKWLIEGRGVDPDVEIQNMPKDVLEGKDEQLETVVNYLLDKVKEDPKEVPPPPPYPNKARPRGSDISFY
jgi:tricorn protease